MASESNTQSGGGDEHDGVRYRWRAPAASDEVEALHAAAFEEAPGRYQWDLARRVSLGWVTATLDGDLVGFVNVAWDGHRHAFLVDTVVAADHRRRGIGRQMVGRAVRETRRAGCEFVHVDFEPHLAALYRSSGFTETAAGLLHLG